MQWFVPVPLRPAFADAKLDGIPQVMRNLPAEKAVGAQRAAVAHFLATWVTVVP